MKNPIYRIEAASITTCPAIPTHALTRDPRNYKSAVLAQLENRAFGQPVCTLGFLDITPRAVPFLTRMASTYNLTIYYQCKLQTASVPSAKPKTPKSLTQDQLLELVEDDTSATTVQNDGPLTK